MITRRFARRLAVAGLLLGLGFGLGAIWPQLGREVVLEKATPEGPAAYGEVLLTPVDPNAGMMELLIQSEDLRQIGGEWRRIWLTDQPSHLTYDRIHGGLQ
jgi:hypothetical protein